MVPTHRKCCGLSLECAFKLWHSKCTKYTKQWIFDEVCQRYYAKSIFQVAYKIELLLRYWRAGVCDEDSLRKIHILIRKGQVQMNTNHGCFVDDNSWKMGIKFIEGQARLWKQHIKFKNTLKNKLLTDACFFENTN